MPDPRSLRVGDRVRFVSLPEEWLDPEYSLHECSREFMELLIARGRSYRIAEIHEDGYPWIDARVRGIDNSIEYHNWGIYEATGWRKVEPRSKKSPDPGGVKRRR